MINTALLKEQLKRFWGLSALLFAWYALTIALPIYTNSHPIWQTHLSLLTSLLNMENGFIIFSMPLLQNRPDLIDGIDAQSGRIISRNDHILEFIDALKKDHDLLIAQSTFNRTGRLVRIIIGSEGLHYNRYNNLNTLRFRIERDDLGHVRNWLVENGY